MLKIQLIDDIRRFWRFISVWLTIIAAFIQSVFIVAPDVILEIWRVLPDELKAQIPPQYIQWMPILILGLAVISRAIKQKR